ncbi:MAG: hypothetical protein EOM51_11970, partial [Clostridia bacterium]|nr:hypothetical protein [Clostridia bacterium]
MLIPKTTEEKLTLFKERFDDAKGGNSIEHELFQKRLDQYNGTHELTTPKGGEAKKATIVRPVTDELIEGQITSSYPLPKIEPRRQSLKGRERARKIEAMLTAEHKRMSYQYIHDEDERSTKIFGGNIQQVDWDNTKYTHDHVGEVCVRNINPMQFEPQEGITDIHELDYYFFTEEDTAERIFEKYGIPHELLTQKDNEKLEHHFCQYVNN